MPSSGTGCRPTPNTNAQTRSTATTIASTAAANNQTRLRLERRILACWAKKSMGSVGQSRARCKRGKSLTALAVKRKEEQPPRIRAHSLQAEQPPGFTFYSPREARAPYAKLTFGASLFAGSSIASCSAGAKPAGPAIMDDGNTWHLLL